MPSLGIRYELNTALCPGPPIHETFRSPRHVVPTITIIDMLSVRGGVVPGPFADGDARHPADTQCRRGSAWATSYTSLPVPRNASAKKIVLEMPSVMSLCRSRLPYQNTPSVG